METCLNPKSLPLPFLLHPSDRAAATHALVAPAATCCSSPSRARAGRRLASHAPERVPGAPRAQRWWGGLVPATPRGRLTRSRRPRASCAGPAGAPASCASSACAAALGHARELRASGSRVACARARPPPGDRSAHPLRSACAGHGSVPTPAASAGRRLGSRFCAGPAP